MLFKPGDLVRLSIEYHLQTTNGYLQLSSWPTDEAEQRRVVFTTKMDGPSLDLTNPRQHPPLLYLGAKKVEDTTLGLHGADIYYPTYYFVHLFLLENTIWYWTVKESEQERFHKWFEVV